MWKPKLNPTLGVPIYRQIMDSVRDAVAAGILSPGDQLPSIRELASQLRINPTSAVKAYAELRHTGVIVQPRGRGTFIAEDVEVMKTTREELLVDSLRAIVTKARSMGVADDKILRTLQAILSDSADEEVSK